MRMFLPSLIGILAGIGPVLASAAPTDPPALERAWHGCVRETYVQQTPGQSRTASQRSTLDACRADEDCYVAALMAARTEEDRPLLGARARAWAATVAASVVDPVAAWIDVLRR